PLHADAPLKDSRRPAGVPILVIGCIADRSRQWLLTGIEVGKRDLIRHSVPQIERRSNPVGGSAERLVGPEIARSRFLIAVLRERDAGAETQHSLRIELIGQTESRPEGVRIVFRESAVAGVFENDAAGLASRRRVWRGRGNIQRLAVMLSQV